MCERCNDSNESSIDDREGIPLSRRGFVGTCGSLAALAGIGGLPAVAAQPDDAIDAIWTNVLDQLPDNWGKWGDDDELGAHNYLGSEEAFAGLQTAMRGGPTGLGVFPLQLSYTGEVISEDDPLGDPVFPTRQPARRDNVVDVDDYDEGRVEALPGGGKFADDAFVTRLFLQGSTQYDALAHFWYDRPMENGEREPVLYNGFPAETTATTKEFDEPIDGLRPPEGGDPFSTDLDLVDVTETAGATRANVMEVAEHGTVGRGVLLDVGRYKKDESPYRLDPDDCVTLDDLQGTADAQGVALEKRDILLVRTGSVERARDPDAEFTWGTGGPEALNEPGLCFSQGLVEWIDEMEVPIVGADNLAVEKLTTVTVDVEEDLNEDIREAVDFGGRETLDIVNPMHPALLVNLGVTIMEILYLEDLADQCAEDGIYDFLYAASPLKIERSVGAPVNPVVVKATGERTDEDDEEGDEDGEEKDDEDGENKG